MPSRRRFVQLSSTTALACLAGCGARSIPSALVDITVMNEATDEQSVAITVERDGEQVYRTRTEVAGNDGTTGKKHLHDTFGGDEGDQFSVRVSVQEEQFGPFEYDITCADRDTDDYFHILLRNHESTAEDQQPVELIPRRCGE